MRTLCQFMNTNSFEKPRSRVQARLCDPRQCVTICDECRPHIFRRGYSMFLIGGVCSGHGLHLRMIKFNHCFDDTQSFLRAQSMNPKGKRTRYRKNHFRELAQGATQTSCINVTQRVVVPSCSGQSARALRRHMVCAVSVNGFFADEFFCRETSFG